MQQQKNGNKERRHEVILPLQQRAYQRVVFSICILQYNRVVIINGFEDMFDTLTIVAYLLGNEPGHSTQLHLQTRFLEKQNPVCQVQNAQSPQLRWSGVPPGASSLALIIKDAKSSEKPHYYWVVYNLPVEVSALPFGSSHQMTPRDEGINSWGQKNYHSVCLKNMAHPVTIELVALDKRFSAREPMTGEIVEQKIKGHVLAKAIVRG